MASFITLSAQLTPVTSNNQQLITTPAPIVVQTLKELISNKAEVAGVDKDLALKIAFCESTFRQFDKNGEPLRGVHNPDDVGLFQINEHYHAEKSISLGFDIHTTEGNIDYAMYLLKSQGTKPWVWSRPCWDKLAKI